jgi:nitronate monooxygenase
VDARERFAEIRAQMLLPVVAAPMFLVSGPELVLAACRCGIMGSFPAPNARTIDILAEWMSRIATELAAARAADPGAKIGPWAQNLVVHSTYARLKAELDLLEHFQPPVVITALGSPKAVVEVVHGYGGLVFADVNSVELARKAALTGVDGLALVCAGAGGHTGSMTAFAFVPAVRAFFDGILIVAGGVCDGRGVRAAEALGADLVYMGTRFIAAQESMAVPDYKQMVVDADFSSLVLSDSFTGAKAYYLRRSIERAGFDPDNLAPGKGMNLTGAQQKVKAWKDVWSAGQGVGLVRHIEPVATIVARLREEYAAPGTSTAMSRPGNIRDPAPARGV